MKGREEKKTNCEPKKNHFNCAKNFVVFYLFINLMKKKGRRCNERSVCVCGRERCVNAPSRSTSIVPKYKIQYASTATVVPHKKKKRSLPISFYLSSFVNNTRLYCTNNFTCVYFNSLSFQFRLFFIFLIVLMFIFCTRVNYRLSFFLFCFFPLSPSPAVLLHFVM